MRLHLAFLWFFLQHKWHVFMACYWLGIPWQGLAHDADKIWPDVYMAYFNAWRFSTPVPPAAKLRHYRHSKHYWQCYVVLQDDGKAVALPIPGRHRLEMLADWQGAAKVTGGTDGTAWYRQYRETIVLHPETREWVEKMLEIKGESGERKS